MNNGINLFCWLSAIILFSYCTNNNGQNIPNNKIITPDSIQTQPAPKREIHYLLDTLRDTAAVGAFKRLYSKEELTIIGALNRINPERIGLKKAFVYPDTMVSDILFYTPFPASLSSFDSVSKLILVNKRLQAMGMYENGKLIHWGPVSTGKKSTPTPNGLYHTNYKAKLKISTVNGTWRMPWYFNISNYGGIGLHEYLLPGYPASHSCVRLYREDAIKIYNWADSWELSKDGTTVLKKGTPVIIFGNYNFDSIPSWKKAVENPDELKLNTDELDELTKYSRRILNGE